MVKDIIDRYGVEAVREVLNELKDADGINRFDGKEKSRLRRAFDFMANVGQKASDNARDVRTATASSSVKDMIDRGDTEQAKKFSRRYLGTNLAGIGIGALASAAPAVTLTRAFTVPKSLVPGGTFWTNPLAQQFAASALGGMAIDTGSQALTGKTWGQNLVSGLSDVTGYDVSSIPGANFVADMTNPGYLTPYGVAQKAISYLPRQVEAAKETEAAIRKLRSNQYLRDFVNNANTVKYTMEKAGVVAPGTAAQRAPKVGAGYDSITRSAIVDFANDGLAAAGWLGPRTNFTAPSLRFQQETGMLPEHYPSNIDFTPLVNRIKSAVQGRDIAYDYLRKAGHSGNRPHLIFSSDPVERSYSFGTSADLAVIGIGSEKPSLGSIAGITGHEVGHSNPIFNTRHRFWKQDNKFRTADSPFYGNDYSQVPSSVGTQLLPEKRVNAHDYELSENYSDLIGLKTDMNRLGIHRSDRPYNLLDVYRAKLSTKLPGGSYIRYLDYHSPRNTVKALNEIKAEGGKIHIKPENRGKFTALKKRTGHSASWFKEHGTPAQKKMAVFALNARKWKHADGGLLHLYDGLSAPTGKLWRIGETEYEIPAAEQPTVQVPMRDKQAILLQEAPVIQVRPEERILTKPVEPIPQDYGDTLGNIRSALQQQGTLQAEAKPLEELDLSIPAVTIPSRDSNAFFRGAAERELQKAYEFDPTGKSRDEIRETQARLADEGYFASQLAGKSRDEIKAIQHKLIQKGLLSSAKNADGTYKEMDGIVGDRTTAAYNKYNVDGLWGNRSKEAYDEYLGATQGRTAGFSADFSTDGIDGCAKWVTRKYESALGGISRQNGVYGNAWQMPMNIGKSGGDVLFNLYEKGFEDVKTPAELVKRTRERLKEDSFDISRLQPGDVVGIFYPGSTHHSDVLEEGTTYNTHVGIVTGYDKDGYPIVEHNVGGHHHKNRADKISLGTITTVSRPKNTGYMPEYPFAMGESKYEVSLPERYSQNEKPEQSEKLKTFMDSMAGAAEPIGRIYTNADMDAVQRIATAVLGRETGFMQNTESSRTGKAGRRVRSEQLLRSIVSPIEPERKSSDLTKFKLSTLSPDERSFLGIKEPKDLENPEKAARASLLTLAKNYDYFVRYANENPQLGLTKQDIEDLTALSYNQGMGRLYTVGTADFNGERRVAPSKLELIRQAAASDEVINDFNATKLGRIATEFPALTGLMRQMFDAGAGTRSTSYMNAARKALENVRAKNSE